MLMFRIWQRRAGSRSNPPNGMKNGGLSCGESALRVEGAFPVLRCAFMGYGYRPAVGWVERQRSPTNATQPRGKRWASCLNPTYALLELGC
jgi:hypothetical protein